MDNVKYRIDLSDFEDKNKALEDLDDGVEILSFTINGRPATKKTNQRVIRRGRLTRILPSIQYSQV